MNLPPLIEVMHCHAINDSDPEHIWMGRVLQEQAQLRTGVPLHA
jgi:LysR family nod box-dependent transcriptional activator